jgi:hypothetical protein
MSLPVFFPPGKPVAQLPPVEASTIWTTGELCRLAEVTCQASGSWTERQVELCEGGDISAILYEPGYCGRVRILVPSTVAADARAAARYALGALAYSLMDLVARQSILGAAWTKPDRRGRPKLPLGLKLSNAQRQERFRRKALSTG